MNNQQRSLETIQDIKKIMEQSSRFISLSGWSGISAGSCALTGAWFARRELLQAPLVFTREYRPEKLLSKAISYSSLIGHLFLIAIFTFIAAFIFVFFFTWLKSKKQKLPLWGNTTLRLIINVAIPMIVGGFFLIRSLQLGYWDLIAPGCLIFYGLALVNGSKYTLGEIRYLGIAILLLGIINLWYTGYGLYFWAAGFGCMHIIYGFLMWIKYERK